MRRGWARAETVLAGLYGGNLLAPPRRPVTSVSGAYGPLLSGSSLTSLGCEGGMGERRVSAGINEGQTSG